MALQGNLKDFGLEAIFQLINSDKRTGTLHISRESGDAEGFIYFRGGKIFGAVSNFNRQPLGERLINAGHITQAQLMLALEAQGKSKKRKKLGQILINENLITQEILKAFVKEQIQNTVFDLLPWKDGEFDFYDDQLPASEDMGLLLSARKLLSQGSIRLDDWDRIRKIVPSGESPFASTGIGDEETHPRKLTPLHWKIVKQAESAKKVTEIAMILGVSEFEVSSHLFDLVEEGLVNLVSEEDTQPHVDGGVYSVEDAEAEVESFVEMELSPEDLIGDRTQYINELAAMTDSIRHGHKGRVHLPSVSAAVLFEKVHLDSHLKVSDLEELISFVGGL